MRFTALLIPILALALWMTSKASIASNPHPQDTTAYRLWETVSRLASPEFGGREAGTTGHEMAREYIVQTLLGLGIETEVDSELSPLELTKGRIHNVLSWIPAEKNPGDRCVVLAAHYDHNPPMDGRYSPGANDNASGVAVLLELARRAKEFHSGRDYDLYFAFPDQEENFIVGSPFVAKRITEKCRQVMFSLTLDVIGAPFFPGFENRLLVLGGESSPDLQAMLEDVSAGQRQQGADALDATVGPIFLIEPFGISRSDYKSFRAKKIPYAFLTAGIPAEYHTPDDTVDKVDFPFLVRVTDYVEEILTRGFDAHASGSFAYEPKPEFEKAKTAAGVADILEMMLEHREENGLTEKEVAAFEKRIEKLRSDPDDVTKLCLQFDVIGLLKVVARKSPVPFAYLKSIIGKIF